MKESTISQCNLDTQEPQTQEPQQLTPGPVAQPDKWNALFSEFLGLSIASLDSPSLQGAKGVYLRIRGTTRILLLTCRHVAFTELEANEDFHHCSAAPKKMIQPGTGTLKKARESVNEEINRPKRTTEKNGDLPWAPAVREFNEAAAEMTAGEESL